MNDIPRLRMFAGPNGSGKSTIKSVIRSELLGVYINPDEIEADMRREGFLDFTAFRVVTDSTEVLDFFRNSTLATEDPVINILRIRGRVGMGGHSVPEDKIISRYTRSLNLLIDAIRYTDRAYIFDNSNHQQVWIAEITDGQFLEMKTERMPVWFKTAVWDKFSALEND